MKLSRIPLTLIALASAGLALAQLAETERLTAWIADLRAEAARRDISPQTLDMAFADFEPIEKVIELDRKQPEFTMTFEQYMQRVVSKKRVAEGQRKLDQHRALLQEVRDQYGVQPRFVVALWGIESNFGSRQGSFQTIHALATLAYDGRRSKFFRGELLDALQILDEGHVPQDEMLGSWAGALGQPQFMPSSFRNFAVDHDGDARRDIWSSTPDVLASIANYLGQSGWRSDLTWGREVRLPADFDRSLIDKRTRKTLAGWQTLGVRRADGTDLPRANVDGRIVQPGGAESPAFLVYKNFDVVLRWNRSDYFATAVGLMSDRVASR